MKMSDRVKIYQLLDVVPDSKLVMYWLIYKE
jgi:hypothetical protein